MEPNTNDQQFVPPTPVTPTPKNSFNWKKVLYIFAITILVAALSGFAVWAYMSKQDDNKSLNAQITTKNKTISSLQSNVKSLNAQVANTSSVSQPSNINGKYEQLISTCGSNGYEVSSATIIMDYNGVVASCDRNPKEGVGHLEVFNYSNSSWQKFYETNGNDMTTAMCTQYKVPKALGTGCTGNY